MNEKEKIEIITKTDLDQQVEKRSKKQRKPSDYTKTESVIHDMLTENTGIHMMDSGGLCGRHWQKNRAISDFRKTQSIKIEQDKYGITITKNLFHFLTSELEYDPDMTSKYKQFCRAKSRKENYDLVNMEDFAERCHSLNYPEKPISDNSYNSLNCLDQDIQFVIFATQDTDYVILQVHGGADIRGGYTEPKVFKCVNGWDNFLASQTSLYANCKCEDLHVYSDDAGSHWYSLEGNDSGFPKRWNFSEKLQAVYCMMCKSMVGFS